MFHPASFLNFEDLFSIHHLASWVPTLYCIGWPLLGHCSMKFCRKQTVLHILESEETSQCGETKITTMEAKEAALYSGEEHGNSVRETGPVDTWLWLCQPEVSDWLLCLSAHPCAMRAITHAAELLWALSEITNAKSLAQCQAYGKCSVFPCS